MTQDAGRKEERRGEWEKGGVGERIRTQDARRREEGRKPKVTGTGSVLMAPLLGGAGGGLREILSNHVILLTTL